MISVIILNSNVSSWPGLVEKGLFLVVIMMHHHGSYWVFCEGAGSAGEAAAIQEGVNYPKSFQTHAWNCLQRHRVKSAHFS